jgi:hypothetical protein
MVAYNRTYQHQDWIDGQDIVQAGRERGFNAEFHALEAEFDKITPVVTELNAGLGAFQPVGAAGAVAYSGGNVGIGSTFTTAAPPTHPLEVNLDANTGPAQQVRFGNVVCCNGGAGAFAGYAVFSHNSQANAPDSNFALRQGPNGNVHINAVVGQAVSFRQGGNNVRFAITPTGNVVIGGGDVDQGSSTAALQVSGDAAKDSGSAWSNLSDARLKKDVRDFEAGLAQLRQVRPVRFCYNGRAGTRAGLEGVGVLGQEIEKIFPEMVHRIPGGVDSEPDLENLRIYNGSALTFVLVNAVKELAGRVDQLEQALAEARQARELTGPRTRLR